MQETMEPMVGACFFSTMDLKSGFWQVKMAKEPQEYTAFTVGSMGVYEFLRILYWLCNALATFQRLMQNCLGKLNLTYALIYLDDMKVLPIDLLFLTHRTQMLTYTIDEYIASLYDCLRESLAIAQDCAIKEAQRQKRLYDHKVGAVELRPGDHVLVRLDAFRGQRRKLKNWWGDDLLTVVTRVADGIPAYVVKNNRTGKKKVVHWAQLLLWLADYGELVRCNLMDISSMPPGQ